MSQPRFRTKQQLGRSLIDFNIMHGPATFSILMYFLELSIQDEVVTNGCMGKRKRHERNAMNEKILPSVSCCRHRISRSHWPTTNSRRRCLFSNHILVGHGFGFILCFLMILNSFSFVVDARKVGRGEAHGRLGALFHLKTAIFPQLNCCFVLDLKCWSHPTWSANLSSILDQQ